MHLRFVITIHMNYTGSDQSMAVQSASRWNRANLRRQLHDLVDVHNCGKWRTHSSREVDLGCCLQFLEP
ncbi:hypothetical protein WT37_04390 [Burkholderia territorii]|nr:hypothetical protein WT37_04390 [Burkholderia territorii]